MTIILQHQYSGLLVDDLGFAVTLSFRSVPESLYIPYESITMFSDPSVEFGSNSTSRTTARKSRRRRPSALARALCARSRPPSPRRRPPGENRKRAAGAGEERRRQIVSIDAFRKRPKELARWAR